MKTRAISFAILFTLIPTIFFANVLPNGLIFRVQVTNMEAELDETKFQNYQPISQREMNDKFTCEVGAFKDFIWAQKANNDVKASGYSNVEIVAYFNQKPVSLDDAFVLMDNQNSLDQQGVASISDEEVDRLLATVEKPNFYYTVQMGVFNEQQVNHFFDFPKTVNERVTDKGHFRYTYGMYYTIQDAKDALRMIRENGMDNAYIIAYDDVDRIPLARAMQMEEKFLYESMAMSK